MGIERKTAIPAAFAAMAVWFEIKGPHGFLLNYRTFLLQHTFESLTRLVRKILQTS
jgi:hypothetical protein